MASAGSGLVAAIALALKLKGLPPVAWDDETVSGALCAHISSPSENFQPMNANYGVLQPLEKEVRDKALKKRMFAERSLQIVREMAKRAESVLAGK